MTPRRLAFASLPDGAGALLDVETAEYFDLNPAGARIWTLLRDGRAPDAIAAVVAREFEVGEDVEAYVRAFVAELAAARLLPEAEVSPGRAPGA